MSCDRSALAAAGNAAHGSEGVGTFPASGMPRAVSVPPAYTDAMLQFVSQSPLAASGAGGSGASGTSLQHSTSTSRRSGATAGDAANAAGARSARSAPPAGTCDAGTARVASARAAAGAEATPADAAAGLAGGVAANARECHSPEAADACHALQAAAAESDSAELVGKVRRSGFAEGCCYCIVCCVIAQVLLKLKEMHGFVKPPSTQLSCGATVFTSRPL